MILEKGNKRGESYESSNSLSRVFLGHTQGEGSLTNLKQKKKNCHNSLGKELFVEQMVLGQLDIYVKKDVRS